ncbi:hypothetical protein ACIRD8_15070 [Streptomyces sp. NPDC102451]|uniref:hypothetical protein n=1 Tax=Streptomyces sp. NPDC102451 TaxID=3366177 RepID=UPI00382A5D4E
MTTNFVEPPTGLPLSPAVKGLRKKYEEARDKLASYQRENARYRTRDVSREWETGPRHSCPALEDAKAELKKLELNAVAEGKTLPNKEVFLGTVHVKIDDYNRTVAALNTLAGQAYRAYTDAVSADLVPMGRKAAKAAQKCLDAWKHAEAAAIASRADLERNAGLFVYCATGGGIEGLPLDGASAGNNAEYWDTTEDGMLTTESAIALGFQGVPLVEGLVVMPEPVIDEAAVAEAKYWETFRPQIHNAKAEGYSSNWDH